MTNAQSKLNPKLKTSYTPKSGFCFLNAKKNQKLLEAQGISCRVVAGSLGLNGHYEYGGKAYTLKDFKKAPTDSHLWVEDDDGNVYDYIYDWYGECAMAWGKKVTFPFGEIKGMDKGTLMTAYKLDYVVADEASQKLIKDTFYNPIRMGVVLWLPLLLLVVLLVIWLL